MMKTGSVNRERRGANRTEEKRITATRNGDKIKEPATIRMVSEMRVLCLRYHKNPVIDKMTKYNFCKKSLRVSSSTPNIKACIGRSRESQTLSIGRDNTKMDAIVTSCSAGKVFCQTYRV